MTEARCRTATKDDVTLMLDWAAEEGWNPGLDDAHTFHAADPDGFFVAECAGRSVAAISVVNHSESDAFLGLYLCRPEYRGKGIGFRLWQHALAHAGSRTVGLDGVPAQQANYIKSGFVHAGETRRLEGKLPLEDLILPQPQATDIDKLLKLDAAANGVRRARFMNAWLQPCATRKTVLLRENEEIIGFATARLCRENCKIGPIIAPDPDTALTLATQAAAALEQDRGIIDVPDSSHAFAKLLRDRGFTESFSTARMYRGPAPTPGAGLHAVTTLELG